MAQVTMKPLSVCMFGFNETEEGGRPWMIRTGLEENGVTIVPCRTGATGMRAKYRELYRLWQGVGHVDALYVVFLGYYLMPLAWYLARGRGAPVILDAFISLYDTEVNDRKRVRPGTPHAWFLWCVDWLACALADAVVVDTHGHGEYFAKRYFVRKEKIIVAPIGCRSDVFVPRAKSKNAEFTIEFHGRFIPLQGIEHILEAARALQERGERVRFEIIGDGQTSSQMQGLATKLKLANVQFLGTKSHREVAEAIARADICLGIFGTTEKALRVIPNKVYECLSMGKAVVTERSPAALEYLRDGEEVRMVPPGDGEALAGAIIELKNDPNLRTQMGARARGIAETTFSTREIVKDLIAWIESHRV